MQIHRQERSIDVALRLISTHTHPEVVERACSLICNLCSACTQLSLNLIILRAGNVECTNRLLAIVHTYSNIFSGYSTISTRLGCILHFSQCTTYCYSTIGDARSHVSSSNLHQTTYNYLLLLLYQDMQVIVVLNLFRFTLCFIHTTIGTWPRCCEKGCADQIVKIVMTHRNADVTKSACRIIRAFTRSTIEIHPPASLELLNTNYFMLSLSHSLTLSLSLIGNSS